MICVSHFLILEVTMCHYSPPNPLLWFSLSPMPPVSQHNQTTKQCRISSKKHDNVWRQPCPQEICECNLWLLQCSGNKKAPQEKMAQQKNQCKNYHMTELSHISWRPLFFCHASPVSAPQYLSVKLSQSNWEVVGRIKSNWDADTTVKHIEEFKIRSRNICKVN